MPAPPVTVVVVHREQPDRCARTVAALLASDVPVRVTVVDNDSSAAHRARLSAVLPVGPVEVVQSGANLGFGPAANVGLRRWLADEAGDAGDWAVVAPHDALPEEGCLDRLLRVAEARPRAGLASAVYAGDTTRPAVDRYLGEILVPSARPDGWEPAGFPHGTLLAARRACLAQVGLFDERWFAYGEEADLALRAVAAGWEVGIVWGAVVRNPHLSAPSPVVDYLQLRNSLLLVRTHFGRYAAIVRLTAAVLATAHGLLRPSARGPTFSAPARARAVADFLRGRAGPPPRLAAATRPPVRRVPAAARAGTR